MLTKWPPGRLYHFIRLVLVDERALLPVLDKNECRRPCWFLPVSPSSTLCFPDPWRGWPFPLLAFSSPTPSYQCPLFLLDYSRQHINMINRSCHLFKKNPPSYAKSWSVTGSLVWLRWPSGRTLTHWSLPCVLQHFLLLTSGHTLLGCLTFQAASSQVPGLFFLLRSPSVVWSARGPGLGSFINLNILPPWPHPVPVASGPLLSLDSLISSPEDQPDILTWMSNWISR